MVFAAIYLKRNWEINLLSGKSTFNALRIEDAGPER